MKRHALQLLTFTLLGSCAPLAQGSPIGSVSWSLDLRADSLIRKFLDLPGEFFSDGHVYGFRTDQRLVEDIVALELHAVPSLIACMGDDRQSKVTSHSPGTGADPYVLVGALCNELLHRTSFAEMKYDSLFELAAVDAGFGPREGGGASYEASAGVLRRDQRIWRAYLARYRAARVPARPRLAQSIVGCYMLALHRTKWDIAAIDTTRRWRIELDTLPLPGTVRPERIELARGLTIGGYARWHAHYESVVIVSWADTAANSARYFSITFGGADTVQHGFVLGGPALKPAETGGDVTLTRVRCR